MPRSALHDGSADMHTPFPGQCTQLCVITLATNVDTLVRNATKNMSRKIRINQVCLGDPKFSLGKMEMSVKLIPAGKSRYNRKCLWADARMVLT